MSSRDHTERFLSAAGAEFSQQDHVLTVRSTASLKPFALKIPGDPSSAAFFIVGAAMKPGSEVCVRDVCLNPTRIGFIEVLKRMGAQLEVKLTASAPEPIGDIWVKGAELCGTRIVKNEIPSLIDELPVLMIAMASAQGESLISGAEELRVKETDRIESMVGNLCEIGVRAEELPDGCIVEGRQTFTGGRIKSFGDHRTAMSFAMASLHADSEIVIDDARCIATSFPSFFSTLDGLAVR